MTSRALTQVGSFAFLVLAVAGCGGSTAATDAAAVDAASVDAASAPDAALTDDAAAVDAGGTPDTGTTADAAVAGDAGPVDQCTGTADMAVLAAGTVDGVVGDCATANFGQEPATRDCIRSMSGLTSGCADCFDGTVRCVTAHCIAPCAADPQSVACMACRAENCDPAFQACSGIAP